MGEKLGNTFERTDVIRMFPTFVWKADLAPEMSQRINAQLFATLDRMKDKNHNAAGGRGWQSDHDLHELEEFRELVTCIKEAVRRALDFQKISEEAFEITGLWANLNAPGVAHRIHYHPNNFLSGIYYVQTQEGADTVIFHDPRSQTGIIRPPVTELTAENTDQVVVKIKNGTLLLFPSWLSHSVDANKSDETRISISFNIMFSSFAEDMSKPNWSQTAG